MREPAGQVRLALLDVVMPRLGGREASARIRSLDPRIRVVFCSGYDPDTSDTEFALQEGFYFLQKPFDPSSLLRTVRAELDRMEVRQAVEAAVE